MIFVEFSQKKICCQQPPRYYDQERGKTWVFFNVNVNLREKKIECTRVGTGNLQVSDLKEKSEEKTDSQKYHETDSLKGLSHEK